MHKDFKKLTSEFQILSAKAKRNDLDNSLRNLGQTVRNLIDMATCFIPLVEEFCELSRSKRRQTILTLIVYDSFIRYWYSPCLTRIDSTSQWWRFFQRVSWPKISYSVRSTCKCLTVTSYFWSCSTHLVKRSLFPRPLFRNSQVKNVLFLLARTGRPNRWWCNLSNAYTSA